MKRMILSVLCVAVSCAAQTAPRKAAGAAGGTAKAKTVQSAKAPAAQASGETIAVLNTTAGNLTCTLFPKQAPKTVANFVGLATGTKDWTDPKTGQKKHGVPMYNGTIFHRVIPNFMIQGGDPQGTGMGGPGYQFEDETSPDLNFDQPGRLAMANAGPNTNGSQFFITEVAYPSLNGHYSLFGQCTPETVELVKQIARKPRDERTDRPYDPVKITSIQVTGPGSPTKKAAPPHRGTSGKKPATTAKKPASKTKKPQPQQ